MMGYPSMPSGGAPASDKKKQALPGALHTAMLVEQAYSHSYPAEALTEGVDVATDTVAAPEHKTAKAKTKAKVGREQQADPAAPSEPTPEPEATDGQPSVTDAPNVEEPKTAPGS